MSATYFVFSGTHHLGASSTPDGGTAVIKAVDADGVPIMVKDTAGKVLFKGSARVPLNEQGTWSVALVHPLSADIDPTGYGYTVEVRLNSGSLPAVTGGIPADVSAYDYTDFVGSLTPIDPQYSASAVDGGTP